MVLPPVELSEREQLIFKLASKSRRLFVLLREHRREIMNAEFQGKLESMYRDSGQGEEPQPPGMMCMAVLLAAYQQQLGGAHGRERQSNLQAMEGQ